MNDKTRQTTESSPDSSRESSRESSPQPAPVVMRPDTLKDKAISAGLWAAGLGWAVPMMGGMTIAHKLMPGREFHRMVQLYCAGQVAMLGAKWRKEVHPDVDPNTPYLFLTNHTNHFDHVVMYNATPHTKQGLELKAHFKYPIYGWYMEARGTIGVEKGGGAGKSAKVLADIQHVIDKGHSVVAFPEGTRTTTGRIGPFRRGLFHIARQLELPIVPVTVTGMYDAMRKGSNLLRAGAVVTVHVDAPISTVGKTAEDVPALVAQTRAIMSGHMDRFWRERGQ